MHCEIVSLGFVILRGEKRLLIQVQFQPLPVIMIFWSEQGGKCLSSSPRSNASMIREWYGNLASALRELKQVIYLLLEVEE